MSDSHDVIIVAAGKGTRLGGPTPKAFVPLGGAPLFTHSARVFAAHPGTKRLVVVVPSELQDHARGLLEHARLDADVRLCPGGDERWQSVKGGVDQCESKWVLVHDAARPFVTRRVIDSLLDKRVHYRCIITATPLVDTVRSFQGDSCVDTLDRSRLLRVGTPQLFHRESLLTAFNHLDSLSNPPTDEAMLMKAAGVEVGFAWGDPLNFKITTPEDLHLAEALFARQSR
ncbi:MAG: 2-C-methyl-D-erythritol 4-phosphate cytidylyltransferase [Chitinivibrionales bacterium]|nr:2-C-methyl-D-erythritol 4-phosphate cytidylyltransferase [Chitinivibrionales bacterium]MBD3358316.1 2-C-methyl-D-erythritol 4-phosphate cytidylyltransferase [Chitinivibrionales bacterium]